MWSTGRKSKDAVPFQMSEEKAYLFMVLK